MEGKFSVLRVAGGGGVKMRFGRQGEEKRYDHRKLSKEVGEMSEGKCLKEGSSI